MLAFISFKEIFGDGINILVNDDTSSKCCGSGSGRIPKFFSDPDPDPELFVSDPDPAKRTKL